MARSIVYDENALDALEEVRTRGAWNRVRNRETPSGWSHGGRHYREEQLLRAEGWLRPAVRTVRP